MCQIGLSCVSGNRTLCVLVPAQLIAVAGRQNGLHLLLNVALHTHLRAFRSLVQKVRQGSRDRHGRVLAPCGPGQVRTSRRVLAKTDIQHSIRIKCENL